MTRVALLGTGFMGQTHAAAYTAIGDVEIVAVVGRQDECTRRLAEAFGARVYRDIEDMLRQTHPDAVDCCLPTPLHRGATEVAASYGVHVICEKPLALTIDDASAMISACQCADVHLLVGHVVRFFPQYQSIADAVRGGRIGSPVTCSLLRQTIYPEGSEAWYRDTRLSGGIFPDLMIHDFDWALCQFGPVERVYARLQEGTGERLFAQGVATLCHRSGTLTQVTGTWGHPGPFMTAVEIAGTDGVLSYDSNDSEALRLTTSIPSAGTETPLPDLATTDDPYRSELAHFMDVIAGRARALVTPEESLAALQISLVARMSASSRQALTVPTEVGA